MEKYNWTLNENDKIVFPVPETVKTPWEAYRGDLPFTLEYFNGTMYEKVEEMPRRTKKQKAEYKAMKQIEMNYNHAIILQMQSATKLVLSA